MSFFGLNLLFAVGCEFCMAKPKEKTNSQHKFQNLLSTIDKRMDHTLETCKRFD